MLGNLARKGVVLFEEAVQELNAGQGEQSGTTTTVKKAITGTEPLNPLDKAVMPVKTLVEQLLPPLIGIVTTVAIIYCVFLGLKLAKAEEPQEREKAKGALKNAIIGYLLIFVLIMILRVVSPVLSEWIGVTTAAA